MEQRYKVFQENSNSYKELVSTNEAVLHWWGPKGETMPVGESTFLQQLQLGGINLSQGAKRGDFCFYENLNQGDKPKGKAGRLPCLRPLVQVFVPELLVWLCNKAENCLPQL